MHPQQRPEFITGFLTILLFAFVTACVSGAGEGISDGGVVPLYGAAPAFLRVAR